MEWHLITGEYPPQHGGVADYSRLVARGLAAVGDPVTVWAPPCALPERTDPGVAVRRLPDKFGIRSIALLGRSLHSDSNSATLLQYVPHSFGRKAMNLPLCLWLSVQGRFEYSVMFHEVAYFTVLEQPLRHRVLATTQRLMASLVARRARHIFASSLGNCSALRRLVPTITAQWMPIPSNISVINDISQVTEFRRRHVAKDTLLIGHFGTYGFAIADQLNALLPRLFKRVGNCQVLLIGKNSAEYRERFAATYSDLAERLSATGELEARELSLALQACDLMMQPYPDGVSTRRGTMMAALAHAKPVVTTSGVATEPLWTEHNAALLSPVDDPDTLCAAVERMLSDPALRARYANAGHALYTNYFDISHTIRALQACMHRSSAVSDVAYESAGFGSADSA